LELENVKTAQAQLIVELTNHREDGTAEDFVAFAIDRQSGLPTSQYEYPQDLGFGMACTDGVDFTFLAVDPESKGVKLIRLSPTAKRE
jgi:hypothetical protein